MTYSLKTHPTQPTKKYYLIRLQSMKELKMWYARWFKIIELEEAIKYGLTHKRNVYGDEINKINCRSIWADRLGRLYRVRSIL